jgi:hypothetical protein
MGTRRWVTKRRHGTKLIGKGCCVYCDGCKVKKGSCNGGRRGGRTRF